MASNNRILVLAGSLLLCLCVAVVPVSAVLTVEVLGSGSYYLGDSITFQGTNTDSTESYLFLSGPNMPVNGGQIHSIDPAHNPVVDQDPATFPAAGVIAEFWSWTWDTRNASLDAGTYTVYAVSGPRDADHLASASYGTISLVLKKPFVSIAAAGDQSYYFGEEIHFAGTNMMTSSIYLFITGPGLPSQGARMSADPAGTPVTNNVPATFTVVDVLGDNTWSWDWGTTEAIPLDPGTYTVFASAYPNDKDNVVSGYYSTTSIVLKEPFITATVNRSTGPVGTVFRFMGVREGGASPAYYANIFATNNSPPYIIGSLPVNGVKPDDFSVESISGVGSTFVQAFVGTDRIWYYDWDTSAISNGSILPGSQYLFGIVMYPLNKTDANGYITRVAVGIEGPVHADYTVDKVYGTKPLTVEFTDISTGITADSYIDFGDGTSANFTSYSMTHTYTGEGTFFPVIHAWNSISSDSGTNASIAVSVSPDISPDLARAYNVILHDPAILNDDTSKKAVYAYDGLLAPSTTIRMWGDKPEIVLPAKSGYFFFIDDYPDANWEHPSHYVHVDTEDKSTTYPAWSPPNIKIFQIAGVSLRPYGGISIPEMMAASSSGGILPGRPVPTISSAGSAAATACMPDSSHNYALLISGGVNRESNNVRYFNDIKFMYNTLVKDYGYKKDHIRVLMSDGLLDDKDQLASYGPPPTYTPVYANSAHDLDGDKVNDVNGAATKEMLVTTLGELDSILTREDDLFIFSTNHGGWDTVVGNNNAVLYLWDGGYISDKDFVLALPKNAGSIKMTMEQCYSGGFVDDVISAATANIPIRVIATAADGNSFSYGNDFSNAWISGIAMHDSANNPVPYADKSADGRVSLTEGFRFAASADPSSSLEHPVYLDAASGVGENQFLSACSSVTPTITVASPNGGESFTGGSPMTISWSQTGLPSTTKVSITLWKGSPGLQQKEINASIAIGESRNSFTWTIPKSLPSGTGDDYWVKVSTLSSPYVSDRSDKTFNITASKDRVGNMWINTTPVNGAAIWIDGASKGTTNKTFNSIVPVTYSVRVAKNGFYSQTSAVRVFAGATAKKTFALQSAGTNEPPYGSMDIRSNPPEAEVWLNGEATGLYTPATIETDPGVYSVSVKAEGYVMSKEKSVTIIKGEATDVEFDLVAEGVPSEIPEFPSPLLPVALMAGCGMILLVLGRRKK